MTRRDQEEQEIIDGFESSNTKRSKNAKQIQTQHQSYAEAMVRKDAPVNTRLSSKDLRGLQQE